MYGKLRLFFALAATLVAVGGAAADSPDLPFPLSVPRGFRVTLASNRIGRARFIAVAPNGDVLVSQIGQGRVVAFSPGAAVDAPPRVVAEGLELPNGLAFRGADLYIATWTGVVVVSDYPAGKQPRLLFSGLPHNGDHNARAIALESDGRIFLSSGSDCNVCVEHDPRLATVFLLSPGKSGAEGATAEMPSARIFATGLRNASGLAIDSRGSLWAVVNQRDNLEPDHTDLPPEELDLVVDGANYGWPTSYPFQGRRVPNSEFPGADTSGFRPADFEFQAHSAPLQAAFYGGGLFPASYRGSLFVAYHGSWNRDPPTGYKIAVFSFKDGKPVSVSDFVTGWLVARRVFGRPVGLAFAADGSMYISDDTGYLFHVTYQG